MSKQSDAKAVKAPSLKTDVREAEKALLLAASGRIGRVIRPYPAEFDRHACDEAVANLRKRNFVHGTQRSPNLTVAGIEAARELAARQAA